MGRTFVRKRRGFIRQSSTLTGIRRHRKFRDLRRVLRKCVIEAKNDINHGEAEGKLLRRITKCRQWRTVQVRKANPRSFPDSKNTSRSSNQSCLSRQWMAMAASSSLRCGSFLRLFLFSRAGMQVTCDADVSALTFVRSRGERNLLES